MFSIKSTLAALALSFSAAFAVAPVAIAQGTTTIVIDQAVIMRDSKAGKDIQTKITAIEAAMERELKPVADQLQAESQVIEEKTKGMTAEAIRADTALATQVTAWVNKTQTFNRDRQIAAADLQLTERKAWSDFYGGLRPVLQEVVNDRGAQIMLDRSQVIYTDPAVDATAAVISKLDIAMPTINVVRLSAQQAAAAAQTPQ